MLKRLPFPIVYILEPLLAVPLFASFYLVIAFAASQPAEAIRATGAVIPVNWEAALPNHGGYLRGFLPSAHPFLFSASVVSLAAFGFIAWKLRLAQQWQQRFAAPEEVKRHKVAGAVAFAAWVLAAWLFFTFALPYFSTA